MVEDVARYAAYREDAVIQNGAHTSTRRLSFLQLVGANPSRGLRFCALHTPQQDVFVHREAPAHSP